jgi:hypothetical protein
VKVAQGKLQHDLPVRMTFTAWKDMLTVCALECSRLPYAIEPTGGIMNALYNARAARRASLATTAASFEGSTGFAMWR